MDQAVDIGWSRALLGGACEVAGPPLPGTPSSRVINRSSTGRWAGPPRCRAERLGDPTQVVTDRSEASGRRLQRRQPTLHILRQACTVVTVAWMVTFAAWLEPCQARQQQSADDPDHHERDQ